MKRILKFALGLLIAYLIIRLLLEYLRPARVELARPAAPPPPPPAPPPVEPSPVPVQPPPAPPEEPERLDLNQADAADLTALRGIGPALAQRVVEYRQQAGPFASLDDLTQVSGIGPALVERLRPLLTVG
jgi:competence protein ComEA